MLQVAPSLTLGQVQLRDRLKVLHERPESRRPSLIVALLVVQAVRELEETHKRRMRIDLDADANVTTGGRPGIHRPAQALSQPHGPRVTAWKAGAVGGVGGRAETAERLTYQLLRNALTSLVRHEKGRIDGSDDDPAGLCRYPTGDLVVGLDPSRCGQAPCVVDRRHSCRTGRPAEVDTKEQRRAVGRLPTDHFHSLPSGAPSNDGAEVHPHRLTRKGDRAVAPMLSVGLHSVVLCDTGAPVGASEVC